MMKRFACMCSVVALVVGVALANSFAGAGDEAASIKDVMGKLHKGAKSPLAKLKTQLKSDSPNWAEVQGETKDFVILGAALAKFDPPRGEASAYKGLATKYYESAKALDTAAQNKDAGATKTALSKISSSCKECHAAHKEQ